MSHSDLSSGSRFSATFPAQLLNSSLPDLPIAELFICLFIYDASQENRKQREIQILFLFLDEFVLGEGSYFQQRDVLSTWKFTFLPAMI